MPKGNRQTRPGTPKDQSTTVELEVIEGEAETEEESGPWGKKQPWMILPGEPSHYYEAFTHWLRQAPPRNFKAITREHRGVNWHVRDKWRWDQRGNAFDRYIYKEELVRVADERKRKFQEIGETGNKMVDLAKKAIESFFDKDGSISKPFGAEGIARLADIGAKLIQIGIGKPTEDVNATYSTLEQFVREAHKEEPDAKTVTD